MFFTFLVVAILTAVVLVVAAQGRAVRVRYPDARTVVGAV